MKQKIPPSMKALLERLGDQYEVREIDWEQVIYRDFGNGFNVEISRVSRANLKKAIIYLWYGDRLPECLIVKTVHDVPREEIGKTVEELYEYSKELISQGLDSRNKLFRHKFKIWNIAQGCNRNHRFYYGSQPEWPWEDKSMFSRGTYECKALMKNRNGMPVVISQNKDPEFPVWKVEFDMSCLVFGSYEEAMAYCRERFQKAE